MTAGHKETGRAEPEIVWFGAATVEMTSNYIIKDLIDAGALTAIIGASGCGKTFVAIDLGCHVGAGLYWHGLKVRRGVVLYLAAEAGRSILRRFVAWRTHHGEDDVKLAIRPWPVDLLHPKADTGKIIELCRSIAEHGPVVMVIVDTVARAMPGGQENASEDVGTFIANCDRIRAETGAAVVLVHHLGKTPERGSRGHSSLPAAVDVEMTVVDHVAVVTKARDHVAGTEFPFKLDVVDLGHDDEGDAITSCVAVAAAPSAKTKRRAEPKGQAGLALAALKRAVADAGEQPPYNAPSDVRAVAVEMWRGYFYRDTPWGADTSQESKRKAFKRAMTDLVNAGYVVCRNEWAWPC